MAAAEENTGNGRSSHPANFGSGHWQRPARGAQLRLTAAVAAVVVSSAAASPSLTMIISKKNRREICKYLFHEGVLYAKKDNNLSKHLKLDVPNLEVIKLMQSFKSKE
ncbi:unnamed protein product [Miscanthus lutarioriparius]|uniref:Plectin/eS10 N-terminal domain-containing protein n=1 Tax=Miscanthus lutarioriparius TaxID=422564 RepID=A0A811PPL5_9POAL|nr:unnamed protein product [Miscanthus lutarioriparius]